MLSNPEAHMNTNSQNTYLKSLNALNRNAKLESVATLLDVNPQLKNCLSFSQELFETHFASVNQSQVDTLTWLELISRLEALTSALTNTARVARQLLNQTAVHSDLASFTAINWKNTLQRENLMNLFPRYEVDSELISMIDEGLTENSPEILKFLTPDLFEDLLALLDEQISDLAINLNAASLATSSNQQKQVLGHMLGLHVKSDNLAFDIFGSQFNGLADIELSLVGIAACAVVSA